MSMGLIAGFWCDFSFISKNLHKSKNKGNFIIVTSKVAIIKWSYFLTYVTPRPKMAKSMKPLFMLLRKTAVFRCFSEWRLLTLLKMTREVHPSSVGAQFPILITK